MEGFQPRTQLFLMRSRGFPHKIKTMGRLQSKSPLDLFGFSHKIASSKVKCPLHSWKIDTGLTTKANKYIAPIVVSKLQPVLTQLQTSFAKLQAEAISKLYKADSSEFVRRITGNKGLAVVTCLGVFQFLIWLADKVNLHKVSSPCQVGDTVTCVSGGKEVTGIVKYIGFFNSKIGTVGQKEVNVLTKDLTSSTVIRKVKSSHVSIEFEFLAAKIQILLKINDMSKVEKNSPKVYLIETNEHSIKVTFCCKVQAHDLHTYFEMQERIMLTATAVFEGRKASFP